MEKKQSTDVLKTWLKRALWLVPSAYTANFIYAVTSAQTGGTFGDTFGAANALFSGTALLMLVLAIILQREELEIVKQERNDTKKLLEGQESITKLQEVALKKQSFEQSFFSILSLISQEKASLDKPLSRNSEYSRIYQARDSAKSSLKEILYENFREDDTSVNNYIADCGTVCRLFTSAYYMIEEIDYLPRTTTIHYVSALHALIDAEIAHVWCFLSIVWEHDDPRSGKAFVECQGTSFLDLQFRGEAYSRLKVAVENFELLQSSKPH